MVSVIMSVYNEELYMIKESINSILNQTYKGNLEIIVVVDNPNNKSAIDILIKLKHQYKNIKILVNEKNEGLAYSLNRGINEAKGKYICRMDADDISFSNRIELQISFLEKNNLDFVSSYAIPIDKNKIVIGKIMTCPIKHKDIKKILKYTNCLIHPTWFFKKNIYDEIKGYRETMIAAQDYDFAIRMLDKNFKLGTLNEPLLYYRIRENAISTSKRTLQTYLALYSQNNVYRGNIFDESITSNILRGNDKEYANFRIIFEGFMNSIEYKNKIYWLLKGYVESKTFRRFILNGISIKFIKNNVFSMKG